MLLNHVFKGPIFKYSHILRWGGREKGWGFNIWIIFGSRHNSAYITCAGGEAESSCRAIMSLPKLTEVPMEAKALAPRAAGEGSVSRESLSKGQGLPVCMMPRTNRWYMMVLAPWVGRVNPGLV